MLDWALRKRAALEYSRLRPRLVYEDWTPTPDTKIQQMPTGTIGVQSIDYGLWVPSGELHFSTGTEQGWDDSVGSGQLILHPAPAAGDTIQVVWKQVHQPDEGQQTHPTIPAEHSHFIDDLELALHLDIEADSIQQGPVIYTLGQAEISREEAADGLRRRAADLRQRVQDALGEPLAYWS